MKKVLLLIAATCTLSGVSMGHTSPLHPTKVISVLDFGAKPNDGKDDTKALRKAAQYCRDNQGTTLEMPAGIYQLRDTKAEKLERMYYPAKWVLIQKRPSLLPTILMSAA